MNPERFMLPFPVRGFLVLVMAGYLVYIGLQYHQGFLSAAEGERPLWTDYTPTYGAALLARHETPEALYRPQRMAEATRVAANAAYGYSLTEKQLDKVGFPPWMYPPTLIVLILPLAYLAYLPSLAAWTLVTAAPYLASMRAILPARDAWLFALAAPPTFYNLMYGQTGFLVAGLIALGLTFLRRAPWLAGLFIGLASIKPHFGVLIPLALAAGGHWRSFASASLTVVGMIIASILLLGPDSWYGFIGTFLFNIEGFSANAYAWHAMASVLGTARMAGLGLDMAWVVQYTAATLVAGLTVWVWWRGRYQADTHGLQCAVLCLAATLAVPLVYFYDLVLVVPASAWLLSDLRARGARKIEYILLAGSVALILPLFWISTLLGFSLGAVPSAILLGVAIYRFRQISPRTSTRRAREPGLSPEG